VAEAKAQRALLPLPIGPRREECHTVPVRSWSRQSRRKPSVVVRTTTAVVLLTSVIAGCGPSSVPTAAELFGMATVIAQTSHDRAHWLAAGLVCPASSSSCASGLQDLVLGGAVETKGQWRVRLLARYQTSPQMASDPCRTEQTRRLVPGEPVLVVGCFNGGSDQESFVAVLGFNPGVGLPEVLLAIDCGVTGWTMRGSSLVVESSALQSGAGIPSPRHPDVAFAWQTDGQGSRLLPAQAYASIGPEGSGFPSCCDVLSQSNA
jgi:hypothetical protein